MRRRLGFAIVLAVVAAPDVYAIGLEDVAPEVKKVLKRYGFLDAAGVVSVPAHNQSASTITTGQLALAQGGTAVDNTTRTANTIFAGPTSGGAGNASFRAVVAADLGTTLSPTFVAVTATSVTSPAASNLTLNAVTGQSVNFAINGTTRDYVDSLGAFSSHALGVAAGTNKCWVDLNLSYANSGLPTSTGGYLGIGRSSDGLSTFFASTTGDSGAGYGYDGVWAIQGGTGGTVNGSRFRLGADSGFAFYTNVSNANLFAAVRTAPNWFMSHDGVTLNSRSTGVLGFAASADASAAADTGVSRGGVATVYVGNGTAGDFSGTLKATTLTGTLSTAAQSNVTSVGTLAGLTMTGTLSMSSTPVISGSPACTLGATTVTTLGMGGTLTVGANTLSLASSTVSGAPTWSSSQAITLSTAAQPNVTSLGTLTGLTMGGTLTVGANTLALASATVSGTPTWSSSQAITLSTAAQGNVTSLGTLTSLATGTITMTDATNLVFNTSTGTRIGTGTTQKLSFWNSTPVVQTTGSTDVLAGLVTIGLRAASSNPPLNLGTGAITCGALTGSGALTTGLAGTGTGSIVIRGTTSGSTTITVAAAAGSPATWTLPTATAAAGAALTDVAGDGTLSWVVPSSGASSLAAVLAVGASADRQINWSTGAGAITHLLGPTDQNFALAAAGTNRSVTIDATGHASGVSTSGALTFKAGPASGSAGGGTVGSVTVAGGDDSTTSGAGNNMGNAMFRAGDVTGSSSSGYNGGNATFRAGDGTGTTPTQGGSGIFRGGNSAGTDKNTLGAKLSSGLPTGTGTGKIVATTGFIGTTGSTAQPEYDRLCITSKTFACSTTTATANTFCLLDASVSNSGVAATVHFCLEVGDGANHWSAISGVMSVAASNRNGTVTATCSTFGTGNGAISDVTTFTSLTTTTTATVSGTNVQLKVTPSWAAGTPTTVRITYQVQANGQTTITPQ